MSASGFVSIVGAGPGDPDLLTVKARRALEEADVVLHDALVPDAILALAVRAVRVPVGKRAGRRSTTQDSIHRLLVRFARRGRRVVRLKGGDPFVFGRGGEEALALANAGIPFEVVPGISAALAAPALSGIPVTHRGVASAFVVVSGHAEGAWRPVLEALPPRGVTLVVLMGLLSRATLAAFLLDRRFSPATPAAILLGAGTAGSWTWHGRLDELAAVTLPETSVDAPGTIVVGEVVSIAAAANAGAAESTAAANAGAPALEAAPHVASAR